MEEQLESARALRKNSQQLSRDMREMNARVSSAKRSAREHAQLAREARKTLEVEAYLQHMIEKLYKYGESVRLQVFPVANITHARYTQLTNASETESTTSAPEFETRWRHHRVRRNLGFNLQALNKLFKFPHKFIFEKNVIGQFVLESFDYIINSSTVTRQSV